MLKKICVFLSRFSYLFSAITVFIMFSVIFSLNNVYPFGELTVSWCDMDQQTIPLLCDLKDVLSGNKSFFLSLQNAGGMNFYGVYFFNLSSPFTYLILFFDKADMPLAVNLMVLLKLTTASLTFALWLKREIKNCSPFIIVALSVTYAFSGYAMMYYQILSWLDVLYIFPLIMLGLKNICDEKGNLLYILSLFACVLCHFYISWPVIIFVCLYAGVYCIFENKKAKNFATSFVTGSIISALLACIILVPCFVQYLQSMRGGNLIQNLKYESFSPPYYTSLPTFFCLALTFPFALYCKRNEILNYKTILFLLMLVPLFIEPISMAFQTYDYMSFPTRYGFITIVLGLTLGGEKLNSLLNDKSSKKFLNTKIGKITVFCISAISIVLCAIFIKYSFNFLSVNKNDLVAYSSTLWGNKTSFDLLMGYYLIILIIGGILLALTHFKLIDKIAVYAVIGALCIAETFLSCSIYMIAPANNFSEFKNAIAIENTLQDEEFYRVKTYSKYFDVNLIGAIGYNSMSHYTSLNRETYMIMAKSMGYSSYWMEVNSDGGTSFTDALMRNKYQIKSNTIYNGEPNIPVDAVLSSEYYSLLSNGNILPFGFLIESGGQANGDLNLSRWQIQNNLAMRFLGVSLYEEIQPTSLVNVEVSEGSKNYCYKITEDGAYLYYNVKIEGKKTLYFDCFDGYSNSLREPTYDSVGGVSVNSLSGKRINYGKYPTQSRNGVLNLGTFENTTARIYVYLNKSINFNSFGVFSVDEDALESAVNQVIAGDFDLSKNKITGNITASSGGQYALFSLPFDEGYSAKVNGEKTKVVNMNGLIAVKLNAGENNVKIKFIPKGFYLGLVAFVMGATILVLYLLFGKKLQENKKLQVVCLIGVIALFTLVVFAVYVGPVAINLLGKI